MKKGWETKKLDDACEVEYGTRVVNKRDGGSKYPVYGGGGATFFMDEYNREDRMVIARFAMSERCTRFVTGKFFLNDSGLTVTPKNKSEIREDFFDYLMFSLNDHIYSLGRGTAQKNLDVPAFRNIDISYPKSLPEQQRIVSVLDEAFASIAQAKSNAERNLVNARELFEAVLQIIVSNDEWEKKTLKEISITFGRGKSKNRPRGDPKLYGGKYPFIQTGDISSSNHWITTYSQTYNELGLAQSKLWKRGTICIAIVGANVGETAILDFDACFPDSVIGIVVNDKTTSNEYVEYLLQTFKTAFKVMGKGTARDNINMRMFENLNFPFPPLAEQRAIVGRLEALSAETGRLEEIYEQKIESLEELKKSVLSKAFGGEL